MAVQVVGGTSGQVQEVAEAAAKAAHVTVKPVPSSIGHYRVNHRCALIAAQAANSRLFEIRNSHASNLIVITRLIMKWMQTAAHTAAIEDSIDVFKVTSFTVIDNTNVVTPTASSKRATMTAAPGNAAVIRGVTVAGAAAGMTGGTMTKDGGSIGQLPKWLLLAQPTAGPIDPNIFDNFDDVNGTHPLALIQNEGIIIENRVLLGAAAGSSVYIDLSYAEVTAY